MDKIKAYKGFDADFSCRGFQYAIGETYEHTGEIKLCEAGFHGCELPLDVWNYYPINARYALVELSGVSAQKSSDSKRVGKNLTVVKELTIGELISAHVWMVVSVADTAASSGDNSKAASSCDYSTAASSGYNSTAASSGDYSAAASSGDYSAAASSGKYSRAASSGNYSKAASSGNNSAAASSGDYSAAASSGDYSKAASSGDYSAAASSGYNSRAASSGNGSKAASSGECTVAMVAGSNGTAKAGKRGAFALAWKDVDQMRITVGIVGEDGILPDTWYMVDDKGRLVKA